MHKYFIILVFSFLFVSCKQTVKNSIKKSAKSSIKNTAKESAEKEIRFASKTAVKKEIEAALSYSPSLIKILEKEGVSTIFKGAKYSERLVVVRGRKVPLLVSPKFDPKLTVPKDFYGSWEPVKYHRGNPLYVKDGCETNLGRMKRGLAPVYYDANKINPAEGWGHYYSLELHHGGQKKSPDYFALMGEEHKMYSKQLHPKRTDSEIARNEFAQKERAPLYQDLADEIAKSIR